MDADAILVTLINHLTENLTELSGCDIEDNDYVEGQKTAWIECLELIQKWELAKMYKLDFEIEKKFPLT